MRLAKLVAGFVALLVLGVMTSGALADGDPFAPLTALTGTTSSSTSSDTTGAPSTSTGDSTTTDAATSTDGTTTDGSTASEPSTTTAATLSPTISTDKADYAPGSTVTLTGSGWGAGESVHLFVNDTINQTWQYNADVTTAVTGDFSTTFTLPNYFVSDYDVTATGASGEIARTTFTDGNVTLHLTNLEGVADMTVTYDRWNGNTTCGVSPSASPTLSNQTLTIPVNSTGNLPGFGGTGDSVLLKSVSTSTAGKAFTSWTSAVGTTGQQKNQDSGILVPGSPTPCISNGSGGTNGNLQDAFAHFVTSDTTKPEVTINQASAQADPTNTSPINFTVVFSETVTGFAAGDVSLSGTAGATTATVTGSGTTYNVAVSGMTSSGTVIATVPAGVAQDGAVNTNNASTSTDNTVTYDNVKPNVTINQASGQSDPTNSSPINFTVVFSEAVTGFTNSDVNLSGTAGATTATVSGGPTTYNVAVSGMTSNGTIIATVPANAASDGAGNTSTAATSTDNTVTYDATRPSVTINQASGQSDPTNGSPINFTVVFSESVTGFTGSDVNLSGTAGATTATVTGGPTTYNVAVNGMTDDGTVIATVPAGGAADAAGNTNTASTSTDNTVGYDGTRPSVTVNQASGQSDPTNGSPINFTVVFSESVTGFTGSDVSLSGTAGATTATVTGGPTIYNVAVSGMTSDGTVIATVPANGASDGAGNTNTASTSTDNTVTYDTTKPNVTVNQAAGQADPTNTQPINFTAAFNEPIDTTTFTSADVTIGGTAGGTKTITITNPSADKKTFNIAVSGATSDGTEIASIAAGVVNDLAGNSNNASTPTDNTVTLDTLKPDVTVNQAAGQNDPTNASPINFTAVFTEPVSGFTPTDVSITGTAGGTKTVTVTNPSSDNKTFNIAVSGMTDGTVIASIPTGGASDAAGNGNTASTSTDNTVTYDTTAPAVTNVTATNANGTYTSGDTVHITVSFGEPVTVTGTPRLQLETGTTDQFATLAGGSGTSTLTFDYHVVNGDASGDLDYLSTSALTLSGGTIKDAATNNADLTLASPGASGSLGFNKDIVIDTTADLSVTKSDGVATVVAGAATVHTYTITVTNNGPAAATNVVLTDTFPAGFTRGAVTTSQGSCANSPSFTCALGTLASGAHATVTVDYTVPSSTTASQTNTASVSSDIADSNGANNSDSDTDTITTSADLSVTKTGPVSATAGDPAGFDYTIGVHNGGPSDNQGFTVGDTLPAGLTFDPSGSNANCSALGQAVTCTGANLGAGADVSFVVHVKLATTVDSSVTLHNSASITGTATSDPNSLNDSSNTVDTAVDEDVHLSISKSFDSSTVTAGGAAKTFTISVTNSGLSDADNVTVSDLVDGRLLVDSTAGDFSCGTPSQTLNCTLGHLAAGATKSITVTYHVASTTDGANSVGNTAGVTSDEVATPVTANASVKIVEDVHLSVTKAFDSATVIAGGDSQTFSIAVHNTGLSDADHVHVTDTVDGRLLVDSVDGGSFDCSASSGQSVDCSLLHVAAAATKTITVTYHVASTTDSAAGISNSASASSDEDGPTTGSDTVDIAENVDLSVTKNFDSDTVIAGGVPHIFAVSVTNSGKSDADNVSLTDLVPARLVVDSINEGSYDCSATSGQSIDCSLDHLAAGDTQSIVVTYHVDTTTEADAGVTNTAAASSEENAATNGSDTVAIAEDVHLVAVKSFADGAVDAGTSGHTFTLSVQNTGTSQADNVSLIDTVDSRLVVTGVAAGDYTCPDGDSDPQTITCSLGHLDSGATKAITVIYKVLASTAPATVGNSASATADDGGSDTASAHVDITTKADVADLKVATGSHVAGEVVTYTSTITNNGPSDAQAVTFSDPLDASLTNALYCVGSGCTPGTAWTGSAALGAIAAGDTRVVVISATIDPSTPKNTQITNTSDASSATTTDPNTDNNSSTAKITVDTQADLSVSKDAPATAVAGDPAGFDYTLTVHNAGPSDNTGGFHVTDTLPGGLTFAGGSATCSASGQVVTCSNTTGVAAGADKAFTVHVKADSTLDSGTDLANSASVATDGTADPNSGNNTSATVHTTIQEVVHLHLTKAFDSDTVTAGGSSHTFTITASNTGFSDADGVFVADTVDSRLHVDSIDEGDFSCDAPSQTINCAIDHLGAGDSKSITVTYHVGASAQPATVGNHATIASDEDSQSSNTDSVDIVTSADLSVSKAAPALATAGDPGGFDYTVTVENSGPSDNTGGFTVSDPLAGGLTFQSTGSSSACSAGGSTVTCTNTTGLAAGSGQTFTIHVKLASTVDSGADLANTANVASTGTHDPNPANDSSTAHTTVQEDAQLSLTKTFNSDTVTAGGSSETFTISVTNSGVSDADHVDVSDTLDGRLLIDSIDNGSFDCAASSGQSVSCSLAHLAAGATESIVVTYHADTTTDSAAGVGNTASVMSDEDDASNSDTVDIVEDVELDVTKTFASPTVTAGGDASSFTIAVTNNGVSDADNLELTDPVIADLIVDSVDPGSYTCDPASQSISCTLAHLAAGATKSITVHYHVNTDTDAETVSNIAHASSDETTVDATGVDSVDVAEDVNLVVTKQFDSSPVLAGTGSHTFTVNVMNTGVSSADNVKLADTVDPRLIVDGVAGDFTCTDGDSNAQTITCALDQIAAGAKKSITVTYDVSASTAPASVDNTAGASSDEVGSAVTGSDTVVIEARADLSIGKIGPDSAVTAGDPAGFDYAVTVTNNGPSDNTGGFNVTDQLDGGLSFVSGANCSANPSQLVTCTNTTGLANGDSRTFTIHVKLASSVDSSVTLHNTAHVESAGTTDATPGNNTSGTTSTAVQEDVHLSISKLFDAKPVTAGGAQQTFTIAVTNSGLSDADNLTETDSVDPRLVVDSISGGGFACPSTATQSISCTLGHLDANTTKSIVVTYHVASTTDSAPAVGNTATVTSDEDLGGKSASDSIAIVEDVKLSVNKAFAPGSVTAGGAGSSFTIAVTNAGASDADNVLVTDTVDTSLIVDGIAGGGLTCPSAPTQSISCTLDHLAAGATKTITVSYHVDHATQPGSVSNTASAKSNEMTATDSTTSVNIVSDADLSITKVSSVATTNSWDPAGYDYTITVKNNGPSDNTTGFKVTDTLQNGLVFQTAGSSPTCSASGQTVTCTGSSVALGVTQSFTIHVTVTAAAFTDLQHAYNTATVATTGTNDSNSANNASSPAADTVIRVDTGKPSSAVTFPVNGGSYQTTAYNSGCSTAAADICGTAGDNLSGVQSVAVSIRQGSGNWWTGSGFTSSTEVFLPATGTTSWNIGFVPPADGQYTVRSKATDNAGNVEMPSAGVTFTIDNVAPNKPAITSTSPASPANNNYPVVNGTAEAGSTVKIYTDGSCSGTVQGTGTAAGGSFAITVHVNDNSQQTFYATSTDAAGNVSQCSNGINYLEDSVAPTVVVTGPMNGGLFTVGGVPAAGCTTTDPAPTSGIKTYPTLTTSGANANGVGTVTVTCSAATDNAGNTGQPASVTYTVSYGWGGFLQPINDTAHDISSNPDVSTFKAGSTVPIKFATYNAAGQPVQAGVVAFLTPTKGNATTQTVDENTFTDPPTSGSTYVWDGQKYQYNWQSSKSGAGYYWKILVKLDDGTTHQVYISLR